MKPSLNCLLDTPLLTIYHDVANGWLYNEWKGTHNPDTVLACIGHILACLDATGCRKMLSDHTEFTGDWKQVAPRVGREVFEQIAARGVSAFAWVHGPDCRDQLAMHQVQYLTAQPNLAIFDDVATAYLWLQQCH
jgi:hypothetical protein